MAFLPVMLDMVDEMYTSLDGQSKAFADSIPSTFFLPRGSAGWMNGGPAQKPKNCYDKKCERACNKMAVNEFNASYDVSAFRPEEITVKVIGNEVHIEGKHEERQDEFGFASRQFSRRFTLPQEFDPDTVSTFLSADGKMSIKAAKPQPPAAEINERVIPIQHIPIGMDVEASTAPVESEQG